MSHQLGSLISEILGRHFGEIVQKVGNDLFTYGSKPMVLIVKTTKLSRQQIIESLRTLLKYDLASFEPGKNEAVAEYRLNTDNVLMLIRYPRLLLQIKSKFGSEAEILIEDMLLNGITTLTKLIITLAKKYKDDKEKNITIVSLKDLFISLTTAGYIQQAPVPEPDSGPVPIMTPVATLVPNIDVKKLMQIMNNEESSDDNVYFKVNFERFHQDFRDEIMITAMTRLIDENAGELMRQMLLVMYASSQAAAVSPPISAIDIQNGCDHSQFLSQHFNQYIKVLEENGCGFIREADDSGGGRYSICLQHAATQLTCQVLDHVVNEKLGSKAARIFRLIRSKKYIEEEHIQKYAMLPDKECKKLTYKLMQEHFVSVRPIRRPPTSGSMNKTIYLYYVNLHEVTHTALQINYQSLHNMYLAASHTRETHLRLLDKRRRVSSIVHGMRLRGDEQQNIQDVEETITPPERALLQCVEKKLKQLNQAEIELDKSLFILQWYLMYKNKVTN